MWREDEEAEETNLKGGFNAMQVTMKQLLEVGAHFGHQVKRWNPKMKKYIFMERNGIHIFDLRHTIEAIDRATKLVSDLVRQGEIIIFVGTKKQAQEVVKDEAERCGMYYVNERWVGGLLTNFYEIRKRIDRLEEMIRMEERGDTTKFSYKELKEFRKEKDKLMKLFGGLRGIPKIPKIIFVADTKKDVNAITEARKVKSYVIAIVDTNCDPDLADIPIPSNDDAIRAIKLITSAIADAVIEGKEGKVIEVPREEEKVEELFLTNEEEIEEFMKEKIEKNDFEEKED